jgi:pyroglutamyl-peptidase
MKALVTGFEAYGGRDTNPAAEVSRALDGTRVGPLQLTGVQLPVSLVGAPKRLVHLIDELAPDIVLCLGLWPGESMIRLERIALNRADFEIPDHAGYVAQDELLDRTGPDGLCATIPLQEAIQALWLEGIPARLSGTAGTFLCNATMYQMLNHARSHRPEMLGGFMHLPYLPSQVAALLRELRDAKTLEFHQRADVASMALDMMIEAVSITLTVTASTVHTG